MPAKNQEPSLSHDSLPIRVALWRRKKGQNTIAWLARRINRPRPTVSAAINRGKFPGVLAQVKEVLGVS